MKESVVYDHKGLWRPVIGQLLPLSSESSNSHDKFLDNKEACAYCIVGAIQPGELVTQILLLVLYCLLLIVGI